MSVDNFNFGKEFQLKIWGSLDKNQHFHSEIEILYVIEDFIELKVEEKYIRLERGDLWIINSGKHHSIKCRNIALYCEILISYDFVCDSLECKDVYFDNSISANDINSLNDMRIIVNQLLNYSVKITNKNELFFKSMSLYYNLLDLLISKFLFCQEPIQEDNNRNDRILTINRYIQSNYNKSITLNDLANKLFLSPAYFSRFFKKNYGMTFLDYLNSIRLNKAVELLNKKDVSMTRIAVECGFADSSAFNRKFKEEFHITPTEYRKKSLNSNQELKENEKNVYDKLKQYYKEHNIEIGKSKSIRDIPIEEDVKKRDATDGTSMPSLINIGTAADILRSDIQRHILLLKMKVGIDYIRFWNPFSEEMQIEIDNADKEYNFDRLDEILDFILGQDIKPFIDLGCKPKRIQKTTEESIVYEGQKVHFENMDQWYDVLGAWMKHLRQRYGEKALGQWYFELWQEEFDNQRYIKNGYNYFKLFDITYEIVKMNFPNAKVGGFGFEKFGNEYIKKICIEWKKYKHLPDFFSLYLFPYENYTEEGRVSLRHAANDRFVENAIDAFRQGMIEAEIVEREVIVTEWSLTISERNPVNDTCAKAAYIVHNICQSYGKIGMLGYFIGSDCHATYKDTKKILFGANGLVQKDGILKPAAYAVQFMNKLTNQIIARGENYIIAADEFEGYHIISENWKKFNFRYYLEDENNIDVQSDLFENNEIINLRIQLANISYGEYEARVYMVNEDYGSILNEWAKFEFSKKISRDDIEYFRHICVPRICVEKLTVNEGKLKLKVELKPNEINYIHIRKMSM